MKYLRAYAAAEIEIKKSRFLAEAIPVSTQEEARSILKAQKLKYPDARHVVHGFILGDQASILGCSDDGEPSGTAGRPVLEVMKGSTVTNFMVTVTRWFGGILLGTGGLVKAYTEATKQVIASADTAALIKTIDFELSVAYKLHDMMVRELHEAKVVITQEVFDTEVHLSCSVAEEQYEHICLRIRDLSGGKINPCS